MQIIGYTPLTEATPCILYPFMNQGTLRENIDKGSALSWEKRLKIAVQVAKGLAFLHNPKEDPGSSAGPLLHLDIKSANILLDENFDARISDFGLSRKVENLQARTNVAFGTIGYLCPDFLSSGEIGTKTDVFAFGVVLAELLTGKQAIFHQSNGKPMNLSRFFLSLVESPSSLMPFTLVDPEVKKSGNQGGFRVFGQIIRKCLEPDSDKRPDMDRVTGWLEDLLEGNSRLCVICMDNPTNGKTNCGHAVLCYPCAEYLLMREEKCPICREKVTSVEQGSYERSFVS